MWSKSVDTGRIAKGALAGLLGGLVGSLTMELFQAGVKKLSGQTGGDVSSTEKVAQKVSQVVRDEPLAESEKATASELVHYAFGASSGMVYGMAAEALPKASAGWGMLFGGLLWMVGDEIGVPAAGLTKGPDETPVSTQASAFAAHLVYGLTTDAVRRGLMGIL